MEINIVDEIMLKVKDIHLYVQIPWIDSGWTVYIPKV